MLAVPGRSPRVRTPCRSPNDDRGPPGGTTTGVPQEERRPGSPRRNDDRGPPGGTTTGVPQEERRPGSPRRNDDRGPPGGTTTGPRRRNDHRAPQEERRRGAPRPTFGGNPLRPTEIDVCKAGGCAAAAVPVAPGRAAGLDIAVLF